MNTQDNNGARGKGNNNGTTIEDDCQVTRINGLVVARVARALVGTEKPKAGDKGMHLVSVPRHDGKKKSVARVARIVGNDSEAPEVPNYMARQKEMDARHPFAGLASYVAWRVLNPGLSKRQHDATPQAGKGSNGRKKTIKGYAEKVTFAGHDAKKLSATDCAELLGAISLAAMSAPTDARTLIHALGLAYRGETCPLATGAHSPGGYVATLAPTKNPCLLPDGTRPMHTTGLGHPFRFDRAQWRQIFTAARATLGVKRGTARGTFAVVSLDDEQSAESIARASLVATVDKEREEQAREERANLRADIAHATRIMHGKLARSMRAEKAGGARQWRANWKNQLRHLRASVRASLGLGHGHDKCRTAAYERAASFREYLAIGTRAEVIQTPALASLRLDAVND